MPSMSQTADDRDERGTSAVTHGLLRSRDGRSALGSAPPRRTISALRRRGRRHACSRQFGIEGVVAGTGVALVVYGPVDAATIPRLEQILDTLASRGAAFVTVELAESDLSADARVWIASRRSASVRFTAEGRDAARRLRRPGRATRTALVARAPRKGAIAVADTAI